MTMTEKMQKHLAALRAKHAELDRMIDEEREHPTADDTKINEYKKQKLKIKEEIEEIEKNK